MKKALALSKVYINTIFGLGSLINDIKRDKKTAAKKIGLFILIVMSMSGLVAMMVGFNSMMYKVLEPINQQRLVITTSIIAASLFTIIIGIVSIAATYFMGQEGDIILSMPFKPWNILLAKFSVNYLSELLAAIVIMATGVIVFGVKSGAGPLFYISSIVVTLIIPIIPVALCYLLIIPFMKLGGFIIKKDFLVILAGFIGIAFGIGMQLAIQSMINLQENPQLLIEKLTSPNGLVPLAGKAYYPSIWGTNAINSSFSISGISYLLLFLLVSIGAVVVLLGLMSKTYVKTLLSGSEVKKKTRKYSNKELQGSFKGRKPLYSMVIREIKLMNREPSFFLNGPMVIFIMPVILGFMVYIQKDALNQVVGVLEAAKAGNMLIYAVALASVFLGVSVNITSTSISREGRAFMYLKSMPIEPVDYINGKLLHGLLFGVLGSLMVSCLGFLGLHMSFASALMAFVLGIVIMTPILIVGIIFELAWPKLIWDNIQKPMKQNINGVVIILGSFIVMGLIGMLVYNLRGEGIMPLYLGILISFAALSTALYWFLIKYSKKRFYDIEI